MPPGIMVKSTILRLMFNLHVVRQVSAKGACSVILYVLSGAAERLSQNVPLPLHSSIKSAVIHPFFCVGKINVVGEYLILRYRFAFVNTTGC